jgi:flagellar biogenesis protein FliO
MKFARAILIILTPLVTSAADSAIAPAAPPSVAFSVLRMIGALCLVLSLFFAGVWAYRNSNRFAGKRGRTAKLRVLETRSLGHRHSIAVVAYDQQRILLATSPTGVTMLTHLPEASAQEVEAEPAPLPNFSTAFLQALSAGRK